MLIAILPSTTPILRTGPGDQASGSGEPALQVSDLEVGRGARVVLRGVSFSAARGERLAILGPSGAGKSTLLLALAGLTRPLRGQVTIDGRAPRPGDAALMFQSPLLFPWLDVLDNVTFGLDVAGTDDALGRRARARELLAMVGLGEAGARRPAGGGRVPLESAPDPRQLDAAHRCGAPLVELHTGRYAQTAGPAAQAAELDRIRAAVAHGRGLGLMVNAGHGLNLDNVAPIAALPGIAELNIGHALVARAVFVGLRTAVAEMRAAIGGARS